VGVLATFDAEAHWAETHVCDSMLVEHLHPLGARWGRWDTLPSASVAADVYGVREGTLLVYIEAEGGHVGVLCEAGEWLAIPAAALRIVDAGEAPDLDLLVLCASPELAGLGAGQNAPPAHRGLPSLDEFIETMLALTGHAADE
jgi:hypothetical protein